VAVPRSLGRRRFELEPAELHRGALTRWRRANQAASNRWCPGAEFRAGSMIAPYLPADTAREKGLFGAANGKLRHGVRTCTAGRRRCRTPRGGYRAESGGWGFATAPGHDRAGWLGQCLAVRAMLGVDTADRFARSTPAPSSAI